MYAGTHIFMLQVSACLTFLCCPLSFWAKGWEVAAHVRNLSTKYWWAEGTTCAAILQRHRPETM